MDSELKSILKSAKNCLKENKISEALQHCKDALKVDRKNYPALVLLGRVCLENGQYEDSKKALLLASKLKCDQPVAWQGLATLLEKQPNLFSKSEAINIIKEAIPCVEDASKLNFFVGKLKSLLLENKSYLEVVHIIEKHHEQSIDVHNEIREILAKIELPTDEEAAKIYHYYDMMLTDSSDPKNEANYKTYLLLLYQKNLILHLIKISQRKTFIFNNLDSYEWISRCYFEHYAVKTVSTEFAMNNSEFTKNNQSLLKIDKSNAWGHLANGVTAYREDNLRAAIGYIKRGCEKLATNLSAWLFMKRLGEEMKDFVTVESATGAVADVLSDDISDICIPDEIKDIKEFCNDMILQQAKALIKLGSKENLNKALHVLNKVDPIIMESKELQIKVMIELQDYEGATKEIDCLTAEECKDKQLCLLAELALAKKEMAVAKTYYETIVNDYPYISSAFCHLGQIYYAEKKYQKALICCLKAIQLDPESVTAFLYLGHYYRRHGNEIKAIKCYEKVLTLSNLHEEAGCSLSDLYRHTGRHEENMQLLNRMCLQYLSGEGGGWALLRLGLHHLFQGEYSDAINVLQAAVQENPKESVNFECLGDAYLSRGSLSAAMKIYNCAVKVNPERLHYSLCQIALIKHMLGEHLTSISDYESVLDCDPPEAIQVVALVGLASVLLSKAANDSKLNLFSNVKQRCTYAMYCLTRAASFTTNNMTIWKLLGDTCSLQAFFPSSLCQFSVPYKLIDYNERDIHMKTQINLKELLQLGAKCYAVALQISPNKASLWHDLGYVLFMQFWSERKLYQDGEFERNHENDNSETSSILHTAINSLKKAVSIDPKDANTWSTLGVFASYTDTNLSQNCFIHSLELCPSACTWSCLGALYLQNSEVQLAHQAFSQAQAQDPNFITSWVGQALVAQIIDHEDAFDLFRHANLLGIHSESCLALANYVGEYASSVSIKSQDNHPSKSKLSHLPQAMDSLVFYIRQYEENALIHNMNALTLEMLDLHFTAQHFYENSYKLLGNKVTPPVTDFEDSILCNYSRLLNIVGDTSHAMKTFDDMKKPTFHSHCNNAMAMVKAGLFEDAYKSYSSALHWYDIEDSQKADVLVALAFLQFRFHKLDEAKTCLFNSARLKSSSHCGLLALASIGLLQMDASLTDAAIAELSKHKDRINSYHHIAFIEAVRHISQHNWQEATLVLSRAIHCNPHKYDLWRMLCQHLLQAEFATRKAQLQAATGAAIAANNAAALSKKLRRKGTEAAQDMIMKTFAILKQSQLVSQLQKAKSKKKTESSQAKSDDKPERLKQAERTVLSFPGCSQSWTLLLAQKEVSNKIKETAEIFMKNSSPYVLQWYENLLHC